MKVEQEILEKEMNETTADSPTENTLKVLLTGTESNSKISLKLSEIGFQLDFLPMELPLKDAFSNFSFKHFQPAIKHALAKGHSLIIGIDEESHKIGIAVRNEESGVFQLLNAHQLGALLVHLWQKEFAVGELLFVKSFHISEMIETLALKGGSSVKNILFTTGTLENEVLALSSEGKHILGITENQEFLDNKLEFSEIIEKIIKYEEQLRVENLSLYEKLMKLYREYGFYKEKTLTIETTEQSQRNHVQHVISECKKNSPLVKEFLNMTHVLDFNKSKLKNFQTNKVSVLNYPSVNMLQIKLADGITVTIVPQEEQANYYFSVKGSIGGYEMYEEANKNFDDRIRKLIQILFKM